LTEPLWSHIPEPFRGPAQGPLFAPTASQKPVEVLGIRRRDLEASSDYEYDENDEYESDDLYDEDSPSLQALMRRKESQVARDSQRKRTSQQIKSLLQAGSAEEPANAATSILCHRLSQQTRTTLPDAAAPKPSVGGPGRPAPVVGKSKSGRDYYIDIHGKKRLKNKPCKERVESTIRMFLMSESELRKIRDNYDANPNKSFKNPKTGALMNTRMKDGSFKEELYKKIRLSNAEIERFIA
jgi:hypothetical protein